MDCAKGTAVAGLCDDLTVDILSRLRVKDVRRSKCVSKPWRDLIADPVHRKKLPQTLEGFFHGGADGDDSFGRFTRLSGSGECAPPVDPSFSFLTAKLPGAEDDIVLLDSCNGLLLFGCTREDKLGYIVCNPATEELVTVPASSASCQPPPFRPPHARADDDDNVERYAHTYLMFDPAVSSRFHLVQLWDIRWIGEVDAVYSYSSETRTWSDRSSKWEQGERGLWGEARIKYTFGKALVNGLLQFFVYHVGKRANLIVAVDREGKICRSIRCHERQVQAISISALISQSQGLLHYIRTNLVPDVDLHVTRLSFWVLEDYDRQEWVLKHNVSCSQLFGSRGCSFISFNIVAIHPDHNSIILVQHRNKELVSYDMESKELRVLSTLGEGYRIITPYVPCFMEPLFLANKD